MDHYITGAAIKQLRTAKNMTQQELAAILNVSDKAISKWETAKGLPDISMVEPLAKALGVSVPELMSGVQVINRNISCNMLRTKFYVCPVCGNILHACGEALISCCGIPLPPQDAEKPDEMHTVSLTAVEDETYITIDHSMSKQHYISFLAHVTSDRLQLVKLYPESDAAARLSLRGRGYLYFYCNIHGLMRLKL